MNATATGHLKTHCFEPLGTCDTLTRLVEDDNIFRRKLDSDIVEQWLVQGSSLDSNVVGVSRTSCLASAVGI